MEPTEPVEDQEVRALIARALREDLGEPGVDVTTDALVPEGAMAEARLVAREACILSGIGVAQEVFLQLEPELVMEACAADGDRVAEGTSVLTIKGPAGAILTGERTALNFMQRMCGIATVTCEYVKAASNPAVDVLCTRKTTPLLRPFEKYAVRCGGGVNHRYGLFDAVLIKDNHLVSWGQTHGIGIAEAVTAARAKYPELRIQVEVDTLEQLDEVLKARPDWVLLDNMAPAMLRTCVARCEGICKTEASGGITLSSIGEVAQTGVDAVSVGALTHSAPSVDLALDFVRVGA